MHDHGRNVVLRCREGPKFRRHLPRGHHRSARLQQGMCFSVPWVGGVAANTLGPIRLNILDVRTVRSMHSHVLLSVTGYLNFSQVHLLTAGFF